MKATPGQMERFVKRAIKYLGCDTARIPQGCDTLFLIIGTNRNTKKDREEGRTIGVVSYKDGKLYDFDYIEEHVIANGKDLKELWASVQWYRKVQKEGWKASGVKGATPKEIMARMPAIKDKKIIEWLKGLGYE